jgi:CHAT domain-containing protein/tetratricopeptide (TPR) repeat protein
MRVPLGYFALGFAFALAICIAVPSHNACAQTREDILALHDAGKKLLAEGKYLDALTNAERAALVTKEKFPNDVVLTFLASANLESIHKEIAKRSTGLFEQGRLAEAIDLAERLAESIKLVFGVDDTRYQSTRRVLAAMLEAHERAFNDLYRQAATSSSETAAELAEQLVDLGRVFEHRRPDRYADALNVQANIYIDQSRFAEAEPPLRQSVEILQNVFGPDNEMIARRRERLGDLYMSLQWLGEAEEQHKLALGIREKSKRVTLELGRSLNRLALVYSFEGRNTEAEPLLERALKIAEEAGPSYRANVSDALNNLALLYNQTGRLKKAEHAFLRSLAVEKEVHGENHPEVATVLTNLGITYDLQGRTEEAEAQYRRALEIMQKAFGAEHPAITYSLHNLAMFHMEHGRLDDAENEHRRSLDIRRKWFGSNSSDLALTLSSLGWLYYQKADWSAAYNHFEQSSRISIERFNREALSTRPTALSVAKLELSNQITAVLRGQIATAYRWAAADPSMADKLRPKAFAAAQWALSSEAARSIAQMSARFTSRNPKLAASARKRQDLVGEWQVWDNELLKIVSQPPDAREQGAEDRVRTRLSSIDANIREIDKALAKDFPKYAALASPEPMDVALVQELLESDEVLLLFFDVPGSKSTPGETFIWLITKKKFRWIHSNLGGAALAERVASLRCGLDDTSWYVAIDWPEKTEAQKKVKESQIRRRRRCVELLGVEPHQETLVQGADPVKVLPFDTVRAHELYRALLGDIEADIRDMRLIIVPSGALASLPIGVLVTLPPKTRFPSRLADYRDVAWLGTQQAISILPSVPAFKALRQIAKRSGAPKPFLGVGDPLLEGDPEDDDDRAAARLAREKHCPSEKVARKVASSRKGPRPAGVGADLGRSQHVDIESVRYWTPLPETADEVCTVGLGLGADPSDILIGARASEGHLKDMSESGALSAFRILHFATHGTLPGQVPGSNEPGLILTPPSKGTNDDKALAQDDGYLSSTEISALKLDADTVVLSACNTAGSELSGRQSEVLSGLARAFFYAGARSVLVSHWEVDSMASATLMTGTFSRLASKKSENIATALKMSMRALLVGGDPESAHPSMWAPFVVVGE